MNRVFIETRAFRKVADEIGFNFLRNTQKTILEYPESAVFIPGTGGLQKIRVNLEHGGKSGGYRVLFLDFPELEICCLMYAFSKTDQDNISDEEKQILKDIARRIREEVNK